MQLRAILRQSDGSTANVSSQAAETVDRRTSQRRSLTLSAHTKSPAAGELPVLIHDISRGGLLIEAKSADLSVGDQIDVEFSERGSIRARVAWRSGSFVGCQLSQPMAVAEISAALLKAPPRAPAETAIAPDRFGSARTPLGIQPQLNFSAAFLLALGAWGLIGLAAFAIIR